MGEISWKSVEIHILFGRHWVIATQVAESLVVHCHPEISSDSQVEMVNHIVSQSWYTPPEN